MWLNLWLHAHAFIQKPHVNVYKLQIRLETFKICCEILEDPWATATVPVRHHLYLETESTVVIDFLQVMVVEGWGVFELWSEKLAQKLQIHIVFH